MKWLHISQKIDKMQGKTNKKEKGKGMVLKGTEMVFQRWMDGWARVDAKKQDHQHDLERYPDIRGRKIRDLHRSWVMDWGMNFAEKKPIQDNDDHLLLTKISLFVCTLSEKMCQAQ